MGHRLAYNRCECTKRGTTQHEGIECPVIEDQEELLKLAKYVERQLCYQ